MKKIIILLGVLTVLLSTTYGSEGSRVCETKYSTINGIQYFSGLHCTEDINLGGITADMSPLKDISSRVINDFIIGNNHKIIAHLESSGSCDDINSLEVIKGFEDVIYSNNDISYTTTTSSIETLTAEIDDLKENYNADDLYNTVFDETKIRFPLGSLDFLRTYTREAYFDKQLDIKEQVLSKQKAKLTLLYKLTESQKFIEGFYNKVNKVCKGYESEYGNNEISEDSEDEKKEALIAKYKEEFNIKLGSKLDSLPRQVLESLSVKLLSYAETSPIFKRFSESQRDLVKLKITALKAAIDDRLN